MRTRLGGPALSLASLAVLALVLEGALRLFGPFLPGWYRTGPLIEPDADVGWHHVPSAVTWSKGPEFTVRVETNAEGRLGPPLQPLGAGQTRILLLGDSFAGATQMAYDRTLAGRLPALLRDRADVQVVNDGTSGYGTDQELLVLERDVPALRPHVVVLEFTVTNDVWNNDRTLEATHPTFAKPYFTLSPAGELSLVHEVRPAGDAVRSILARSWLLTMLKTGVLDPLTTRERDAAYRRELLRVLEEPRGEYVRAWEITDALVRRVAAKAQEAGAVPVLLVAPDACQVHAALCGDRPELATSTLPQERLRRVAAAAGMNVVDPLPRLRRAAADGEQLYFPVDLHWTARGHAIAAEELAAALRDVVRR